MTGRNAFSTYAYPCVKNAINTYLRHLRKNEKNVSLNSSFDDDELEIIDTISDDVDYEDLVLDQFELKNIHLYSKNLPIYSNRDKTVWNLYLQGLTQAQIAEETGYAQSYISRILKRIKSNIKTEYNKEVL